MMSESYLYSPRGVIDMSLFEIDEDKLCESMKHLRSPLSSEDSESDVLPPLSSLSVASSSNPGDDSSSVSSLSCDGDESWGVDGERRSSVSSSSSGEKRSIFGSYWTKKGGRPQVTARASLEGESNDDDSNTTASSSLSFAAEQSYENLLERNEAPIVVARAYDSSSASMDGSSRRRLFNHYSTPSLPSVEKPSCLRKTQSARTVGTPKSSCLRECRYSSGATVGQERPRRASVPNADASVKFCDQVQVQYLKPATENWAERGWSKYFM